METVRQVTEPTENVPPPVTASCSAGCSGGCPSAGHATLAGLSRLARPAKPGLRERLFAPRTPTLVFDPRACDGCGKCLEACAGRFGDPANADNSRIQILRDEARQSYYAIFCQHCREPLCLAACPQKAVSRGADGTVAVDERLCVHCGLCIEACAQCAPRRDTAGRVAKCDQCGGSPLCVPACPRGALTFSAGKALGWIKLVRWPVQALAFLLFVIVLTGTVCSLSLAGMSIACPLGAIQNIFSAKTVVLTTLVAAGFLVGLTVLAGRLFCGWLCPFGFLLDLVGKVLPQKLRLPGFLRDRINKYGLAAAAAGTSAVVGYQAFCTICPIGTTCRAYGFQSVLGGVELSVIPAFAALEISEKRSWCRYLCPVGAVLALCAKIGLAKVVIGAPKCKKFSCMRCAAICPMGIIPEGDLRRGVSPKIDMSECIGCLRCVDACPHGAALIRFRWQKATPAEAPAPAILTPEQGSAPGA